MLRHSNQNKQKHPFGCFYLFLGARIRQSEAHGEYADKQLATVQKRIFLIEFLPHGWLLFIKVSCAFQRPLSPYFLIVSQVRK